MSASRPRLASSAGLLLTLLVLAVAAARAAARTESPSDELSRARELARTTRSWKDRRQVLTLRIEDGRGNERVRKLVMLTRRDAPGAERSLGVFLEPADVRGSALLQHVPATGRSSQWIYLPELGRTRQINSSARRQSFMGTDFSYADLDLIENVLQWSDADADVRRLDGQQARDAAEAAQAAMEAGQATSSLRGVEAEDAAWFELRPTDADATYERLVLEIAGRDVLLRTMEFFGAGAAPEKVLRFEDITEEGGIPTAHRLEMVQPDRGTRTMVTVSGVEYDRGLGDEALTKRALESGLDHVE